ncbi:hypothetical protein DVQ78_20035 [Yersinia enterocolitica]|nr:hypothetical protein [Yersinia enterocolitica]
MIAERQRGDAVCHRCCITWLYAETAKVQMSTYRLREPIARATEFMLSPSLRAILAKIIRKSAWLIGQRL